MIFLKYINYACKIIVLPKKIPTQNCFYLEIHFLSSTTNVILHPLNTHFSRVIPQPVHNLFLQQHSDSFEKSYEHYNSSSSPTGISKHSKTINKNTRAPRSYFHTLFPRVRILRWNTRSRCSYITWKRASPVTGQLASRHANRASRASRLARFHVITIQAGQPGNWAFFYMLSMRTRQTKRNNMA